MKQPARRSSALSSILRRHAARFAYQFGSTVTGHQDDQSDVDVAVFLDPSLSEKQRFEQRIRLMSELGRFFKKTADVVVLNDIASIFFKYIIISEGRLVYNSKADAHVDFELRTMNAYFDYKPFMELYNKQYVQKHAQ